MVALFPGPFDILGDSGFALLFGDALDLNRAGLARHAAKTRRQIVRPRSAEAAIGHLEHALVDNAQRRRRNIEFGEFRHSIDGLQRRRDRLCAACQPGRHHGKLQRCHQHISLPDRGNHRLARRPDDTVCRQLPFMMRDDPLLLARNIDAGDITKAQLVRHRLDPLDACLQRHLIEEDVAGPLESADHIHRAVAILEPAVEGGVAKLHAPLAGKTGALVDNARLQRGQRHDHLEG